jgi:pheromone shutdown-related protein TraB
MITASPRHDWPADVHVLPPDQAGGREVILVGTAHVSRESVDLVRAVIETERPDAVCVELDQRRHDALAQGERWEGLDLREVIRNRQLPTLMVNLLLAAYQRRLGLTLGVMPGSELLEAVRAAEAQAIPIALVDRDIRATLRRAWGAIPFWRKPWLLATVAANAVAGPAVSEEDLRTLREHDVMSGLMAELGEAMPALKVALIDERDAYLVQKIRDTPGDRVVAVVGAGHVAGLVRAFAQAGDVDVAALETIPQVSRAWRWVGWGVPALIVGSLIALGFTRGAAVARENALFWILANAIPTAVGGVLALGHGATVVAAALASPLTSLTPAIGAGYVGAFVQAWVRPPRVREFGSVGDDVTTLRGWWSSRLLKVLLVFLLTSFGSMIGRWVGGAEILATLFGR